MSTTTVCRGLKSLSEPQVAVPITLRLTLAPCESDSDSQKEVCYVDDNSSSKDTNTLNSDFGGWSFLESLLKEAPEDKEARYVHPLDKSSSEKLSNKSLEVCTESLGSETGSDIGDDNDPYLSSSSDSETTSRRSLVRERSRFCKPIHKKETRRSFPPPLTSISGSDYVQYTPRREGGHLVITAIPISTAQTCFQVKRGDGRLRLHFKNICSKSSAGSDEETDDDKEVTQQKHELDGCLNEKIHDEMTMVKYQRAFSWCNDSGCGNKGFLNLKPFLGVAI